MSKIRQQLAIDETKDLGVEPDLRPYVVLTQLAKGKPFRYAGWLDAADDEMAMSYAKQHYGRDQEVVAIWAIDRDDVAGTEPEYLPSGTDEKSDSRSWQVFTQEIDADAWLSVSTVDATNAAEALEKAKQQTADIDNLHAVWIAPVEKILATDADELVWRYTDQTYRLARGYSKDVRAKWDALRASEAVDKYQQEDLTEAF